MTESHRKTIFSSKNNSWCTPRDLFAEINKEFNFTLDPCCMPKSALCKKYYTPDDDGLKQNWDNEIVFCNPPYNKIKDWVKKSSEAKGGIVVMLIPCRTDTKYFHEFIYNKAEIRFIKGRLKFIDLDRNINTSPSPFPSMLVIFKNK